MSKKVLHIAEAPGGVERYLISLTQRLKENVEYENILVCSEAFSREKFDGSVSGVECVESMQNALNAKKDFAAVRAVRKLIKKYRPDIVYCHSSKAGAIGRLADFGIKNKLIYNGHGWSFNMRGVSGKKLLFYRLTEKMLAFLTDKIVCISEYEKHSALENKICKEDKLVVINNGIDFEEFSAVHPKRRSELGIPEDAFLVGMIGRLAPQKAPDVFVDMAYELKKKLPRAFFIIVGDGTDREAVENQIRDRGLDSCFIITGWVDNPLDYVGLFDVAALLSRWEGFGLVLPEYMAADKPIVASRADAIPFVVGDAGLLVDCENASQSAEAVLSLFENPELRESLVEKGRKRRTMFDVQRTANEHIALFNELTE